MKEQEDKILDIQLAALGSSVTFPTSEEIFNSYRKTKENLREEIIKSKLLQERVSGHRYYIVVPL